MTRYTIDTVGEVVEICVHDAGAVLDDLAEAFRDCRDGSCACPTDEYAKVADLSVASNDVERQITVRLTARPGQALDLQDIDACVRYTLARGDQTASG